MPSIIVESSPAQTRLDQLGVDGWPIWTSDVADFPWHYDAEEICYLLAGEVIVTPDGGAPITLHSGDLVTFAAGLDCRWQVVKAVRKHYTFR